MNSKATLEVGLTGLIGYEMMKEIEQSMLNVNS